MTRANPIPTGKATARPEIEIAATSSMFARLKIPPAAIAMAICRFPVISRLSMNDSSSPILPNVKAAISAIINTPNA